MTAIQIDYLANYDKVKTQLFCGSFIVKVAIVYIVIVVLIRERPYIPSSRWGGWGVQTQMMILMMPLGGVGG